MALTERGRASFYRRLGELIHDEEAVGEMLSNVPAHGTEEPATRDFVRAEFAELSTEVGKLRDDLHVETGAVRIELAALRTEIVTSANRTVVWALGFTITMVGLVFAIARTV